MAKPLLSSLPGFLKGQYREMCMTVFNSFDEIQIINLPSRTDRRREMNAELKLLGLLNDPRISYFPAIRPGDRGSFSSIGARGVYESQKQILRAASAANKSVLILEDDCEFVLGAQHHVMPEHWTIFYGGYEAANPDELLASDIIGAHMMGFSRQGAHLVSAYLEDLDYDGQHPPIDAAYIWFRRAYPHILTHFAVPPLAEQRSSRSDIADLKWFDKMPVVRALANALRAFLRKLTRTRRPGLHENDIFGR
jgi:glycosyl transferase family 25